MPIPWEPDGEKRHAQIISRERAAAAQLHRQGRTAEAQWYTAWADHREGKGPLPGNRPPREKPRSTARADAPPPPAPAAPPDDGDTRTCPACSGNGEFRNGQRCTRCGGTGQIPADDNDALPPAPPDDSNPNAATRRTENRTMPKQNRTYPADALVKKEAGRTVVRTAMSFSRAAKELAAAENISISAAQDRVQKERPDLYELYLNGERA
jgi:hypothetical protein